MSASDLLNQAKMKAPYQVRRLSSWTVGATSRATKLPIPHRLEFSGLSTFKGKVDFEITPGVNVIYGAAHNGKTTIANSLLFGLFGVLPARGMSFKYFTGRLVDKEFALRVRMGFGEESPLYEAAFSLGQELSQAKCTLHEVQNKDSPEEVLRTSRMQSLEEIRRAFMEKIGIQLGSIENFINLAYLQEERNYLLGTRLASQDGRFIRASLVTSLAIGDFVNSVINQGREELKSVKNQQNDYARKATHIQSARGELLDTREVTEEQPSKLRKKRAELAEKIQQMRQKQEPSITSLMTQISALERELVKIERQLANATKLTGSDLQCDLCEESIPTLTVQKRVEEGICPICGEGTPYIDAQIVGELKASEKETVERINTLRAQVEELVTAEEPANLQETLQEYAQVTTELWERERERGSGQVSVLADEFAANHLNSLALEAEAKKIDLDQELGDIEKAIAFVEQYRREIFGEFLQNLNIRFKQLQNSLFTKILIKELNPDLSLNISRERFEDFSKTERNLAEILFRLSLLDTTKKPTFMLLETPSSDLDESYKESLAMLLNSYAATRTDQTQKQQTIVLTSLDPRFVNQLFEGTEKKVFSLLKRSTTTTPRQLKRLDEFF
ncbi:MAG: AAA family ATPase [Candidatus Hodarchaeales archaeon]|jgi:DNA repair exonuclease SbcCD ATPase subunit